MKKYHGVIFLSVAVEARNPLDANETLSRMVSDVSSSEVAEVIKVTTDVHSHETESLSDIIGGITEMIGGKK